MPARNTITARLAEHIFTCYLWGALWHFAGEGAEGAVDVLVLGPSGFEVRCIVLPRMMMARTIEASCPENRTDWPCGIARVGHSEQIFHQDVLQMFHEHLSAYSQVAITWIIPPNCAIRARSWHWSSYVSAVRRTYSEKLTIVIEIHESQLSELFVEPFSGCTRCDALEQEAR